MQALALHMSHYVAKLRVHIQSCCVVGLTAASHMMAAQCSLASSLAHA